ncbi:MAG: hypothetical protein AAF660_07845 [Pseudomonadota bacterium]
MNGLIEELKRRNVFRVGIAYIVVSWLIVQVVDTIVEPLSLPDWLPAVVIVLLLVGFPIALLFAWAFELTPEGVKRTQDVDLTESVTADTGRKLNLTIIGALLVALAFFAFDRQRLAQQVEDSQAAPDVAVGDTPADEVDRASIAVLPFVNMSDDEAQEHFSDGISEELLNVLAKIPEFKVAARTSSFQFKGRNLDIADVAGQLNVEHVLEGSVRKAGNTVRITAQLIEADSGFHLWSESYDRELDDIFAIQDEISSAIVMALSDALGLSSGMAAPLIAHTTSDQNYNDYLLARELILKRNEVDLLEARSLLQQVTERDPEFAPALVQLALSWYLLTDRSSTYGSLPFTETIPIAVELVDKALALAPNDAEALGVKGLLHFDETGDGAASLDYMRRSLAINPSQTDVRAWYATSLQFTGEYEESDRQLAIGLEYDPLSMLLLMNYAFRLVGLEDVDRLQPIFDRVDRLDPARASSLRSMLATRQGRFADAVLHNLDAIDKAPDEIRYRLDTGYQFLSVGMLPEARQFLSGPSHEYWFAFNDFDYEAALRIATADMNNAPDAFAVRFLDRQVSAHFHLGNYAETIELGLPLLDEMPIEIRHHDWTNYIVAASLIIEGDEERAKPLLERYVVATEADLNSGTYPLPRRYFGLAQAYAALGNRELALQNFSYAAERAAFQRRFLSPLIEHMGQDDDAGYQAVFDMADQRFREEIGMLREAMCVEGRFSVWQPTPTSCQISMPEASESS